MITKASVRDISYLGAHLRPEDVNELLCQLPEGTTPQQAALLCADASTPDLAFVARLRDGTPAAAFGFAPTHNPALWAAWGFGTKNAWRTVPEITAYAWVKLFPYFMNKYLPRRLEARSLATHTKSHIWLTSTGFEEICNLPDFGRDGETFKLFAITRKQCWTCRENWIRRHTVSDKSTRLNYKVSPNVLQFSEAPAPASGPGAPV